MQIKPFGVEIWMNEFETKCELNLAETCVDSLTIAQLLALTGRNDDALSELLPMRMGYGAITGSPRLKTAICGLYDTQTPDRIIVTHGTIGANHLVHLALVEPGDVVVAVVPAARVRAPKISWPGSTVTDPVWALEAGMAPPTSTTMGVPFQPLAGAPGAPDGLVGVAAPTALAWSEM